MPFALSIQGLGKRKHEGPWELCIWFLCWPYLGSRDSQLWKRRGNRTAPHPSQRVQIRTAGLKERTSRIQCLMPGHPCRSHNSYSTKASKPYPSAGQSPSHMFWPWFMQTLSHMSYVFGLARRVVQRATGVVQMWTRLSAKKLDLEDVRVERLVQREAKTTVRKW